MALSYRVRFPSSIWSFSAKLSKISLYRGISVRVRAIVAIDMPTKVKIVSYGIPIMYEGPNKNKPIVANTKDICYWYLASMLIQHL